jgi:hypothetical protein
VVDGQTLTDILGIGLLGVGGEPGQVGEENGDHLPDLGCRDR